MTWRFGANAEKSLNGLWSLKQNHLPLGAIPEKSFVVLRPTLKFHYLFVAIPFYSAVGMEHKYV